MKALFLFLLFSIPILSQWNPGSDSSKFYQGKDEFLNIQDSSRHFSWDTTTIGSATTTAWKATDLGTRRIGAIQVDPASTFNSTKIGISVSYNGTSWTSLKIDSSGTLKTLYWLVEDGMATLIPPSQSYAFRYVKPIFDVVPGSNTKITLYLVGL